MPTLKRFQMFSQSPQQLAAQMLGRQSVAPRAPSRAYEVQFSRPAHAQGVIAPSQSWYLGNGNGLGGLGALSGTAVIPGLLSFNEAWTYSDFMGDANWVKAIANKCGLDERYSGGISYTAPSGALILQASTKWRQLTELRSTNPALDAFMVGVESAVGGATQMADSLVNVGQDALCGKRTNEVERQRVAAFNTIKGELAKVVAYTPSVSAGAGSGGGSSDIDAMVAEARRRAQAQTQSSSSSAATSASNPYVLPGVIFGGLALVGGFIYWKRKSK